MNTSTSKIKKRKYLQHSQSTQGAHHLHVQGHRDETNHSETEKTPIRLNAANQKFPKDCS